jgi:nicotinamide-nucleotide amidase
MHIELINTGAELMLGFVLNSHQQWLCRQLADHGYPVTRQIAVADAAAAIQAAVGESMARSHLVITTGGLGPTSDDLTRSALAQLLHRELLHDERVATHIRGFFASRNRPMPPHAMLQALVPAGAVVIPNSHGTAPGLALEFPLQRPADGAGSGLLIMLPGPPRELRPMFSQHVMPLVQRRFPGLSAFACETVRSTGLGESWIQERISDHLEPLLPLGLEVGYCARVGEVDIRLSAPGANGAQLVARAAALVEHELGLHAYTRGTAPLEEIVIRQFAARRSTIAVAESCTGGQIAHRLTNVPGASAVLWGGFVTYNNAAKERLLGVPASLLQAHGAVSAPVARAMAEGARRVSGADFAVAVTGIAGPDGGTSEKPVGTVFQAISGPAGTTTHQGLNAHDRETFKWVTSQQALDTLRRALLPPATAAAGAPAGT